MGYMSYPATLDGLARAQTELENWQNQWRDYMGNNPNAFRTLIRGAAAEVRRITGELKRTGLLELTESEKLTAELDGQFPHAKSKDVASWNGKKYQLRFYPLSKSRSGKTVFEWEKSWVEVPETTRTCISPRPVQPEIPAEVVNTRRWRGDVRRLRTNKAHRCQACKDPIPAQRLVFCLDGYRHLSYEDWGKLAYTFRLCEGCSQKLSENQPSLAELERGCIVFWTGDLCAILGIRPLVPLR